MSPHYDDHCDTEFYHEGLGPHRVMDHMLVRYIDCHPRCMCHIFENNEYLSPEDCPVHGRQILDDEVPF